MSKTSPEEAAELARKFKARIVCNLPRSLDERSMAVDVQITPEQLAALIDEVRSEKALEYVTLFGELQNALEEIDRLRGVDAEPVVPVPLNDAQHLLSWMDAVFGNEDGGDWFDQDAASVADGLNDAIERFKCAHPAPSQPAAPVESLAAYWQERALKAETEIERLRNLPGRGVVLG